MWHASSDFERTVTALIHNPHQRGAKKWCVPVRLPWSYRKHPTYLEPFFPLPAVRDVSSPVLAGHLGRLPGLVAPAAFCLASFLASASAFSVSVALWFALLAAVELASWSAIGGRTVDALMLCFVLGLISAAACVVLPGWPSGGLSWPSFGTGIDCVCGSVIQTHYFIFRWSIFLAPGQRVVLHGQLCSSISYVSLALSLEFAHD